MRGNPSGARVVLRIDHLRLLLDLAEVASIESTLDLAHAESELPLAIGEIAAQGRRLPVYSLSPEMRVMRLIPRERRICVVLGGGEGEPFGLLCDEAVPLEPGALTEHPLPECMAMAETPIHGLALEGDALLCRTDADSLRRILALESAHLTGAGRAWWVTA